MMTFLLNFVSISRSCKLKCLKHKRCIEYFSLYICNFLKNKNRNTNLLFIPYDKETLFLYSDLQIVMQYTTR